MKTDRMNYIFRKGAHEVFEFFTSILDVHSAFFTTENKPIYSGGQLPMCDYCQMLRKDLGMEGICHQQDIQAISRAKETGDLTSYSCHGGMQEMALPIHSEEKIIGYAIVGQFRKSNQTTSPYAEKWYKKFGNHALQETYEKSTLLTDEKFELLTKLFRHMVRSIESESMIVMKDYDLISPLINRIHNQPEKILSMEDATRLIGRSKSTINRLFLNLTGQPFRQYQIHIRLTKAKQLMTDHPHTPIEQIAEQLGFDDPFYFSRLFKKHAGKTPTQFRKAVAIPPDDKVNEAFTAPPWGSSGWPPPTKT